MKVRAREYRSQLGSWVIDERHIKVAKERRAFDLMLKNLREEDVQQQQFTAFLEREVSAFLKSKRRKNDL